MQGNKANKTKFITQCEWIWKKKYWERTIKVTEIRSLKIMVDTGFDIGFDTGFKILKIEVHLKTLRDYSGKCESENC